MVIPLNVLHKLEVGSPLLYFLHRSGCQFVGQFAQDDAIFEHVLVGSSGQWLAEHVADPGENLLLLFLVPGLKVSDIAVVDNVGG